MKTIVSISLVVSLLCGTAFAGKSRVDRFPKVGPHYPIFTVEKNENPGNILVLFTKLDNNCLLKNESGKTVFDMYWLMNRSSYKPTHHLIKKGVYERLTLVPSNPQTFYVKVNDLKEVNADLQDPRLIVEVERFKGDCQVKALLTLGPSDKYTKIQLTSIYSEAKKTAMPPFRKLVSVTLKGINLKTGAKVSRTYLAK